MRRLPVPLVREMAPVLARSTMAVGCLCCLLAPRRWRPGRAGSPARALFDSRNGQGYPRPACGSLSAPAFLLAALRNAPWGRGTANYPHPLGNSARMGPRLVFSYELDMIRPSRPRTCGPLGMMGREPHEQDLEGKINIPS